MSLFNIIQGGMGVGVSNWTLANAVASMGQLGVVSGTGLAVVFARRLQMGDPGGHLRQAIEAFPYPKIARDLFDHFFIPGGKATGKSFKPTHVPDYPFSEAISGLTVVANFVEVWLAKQGHRGVVGINYLEKIQLPTLAQLFGAMLAGVDYVLMGAGIPRSIPGAIDALAAGKVAELKLDVEGAAADESWINRFDPADFCPEAAPILKRPQFLAIVSSATLAMTLARKSNGTVDGFVVESSVAGGHNAPPRGPMHLSESGEPVYSQRDDAELDKIKALGKPFYLAGGCATADKLSEALALGASGIQVGTAFAFCEESGISDDLKKRVIEMNRGSGVRVFTDPAASPTSFPFKVVQIEGTISDADVFASRKRVCDMGYLRRAYRKPDGTLGHRCAAEPVDAYVRKGGVEADTVGRKCVCNALFSTIGLGQISRAGEIEPALVTAGSSQIDLMQFFPPGQDTYSAADVIRVLTTPLNKSAV